MAIFLGVSSFFGRPPCRPLARAAARPARVRSRMSSRSNSARAPNIWKMSLPPDVVVSICSERLLKPISFSSSAVITSIKLVSDRPRRSSINPSSTNAGGSDVELDLTGSGFVQSSSVLWNGTPLQTTYASSGELTATVPAADIASAGTASITVSNPSPGGGSSNALIFTINNPAPANNVQLTVEDSHGNPIAGAAITDTHGYTYNLGTTDDGGMVSANLPAGSYTFHVSYHGTSISYGPVDVTADSVTEHTFQTVNAQVNLQTCDGTGLSGGTVRYQSGGYWYYFGGTSPVPTDSNGAASWESFSGTFLIEMDYGGAATAAA